ncbi:MAG: hypothetical protein AAF206_02160 [Bacteroidota bacterium]
MTKANLSLWLILTGIILGACQQEPTPQPTTELPDISFFRALDRGNEGNAADVQISFSIVGILDNVDEMRLLLSRTESPLDLAAVTGLSTDRSQKLEPGPKVSLFPDTGFTDAAGNAIEEEKAYLVYVWVKAKEGENALVVSADTITLRNETVVTTLQTSIPINASEDIALDNAGNLYVNGGDRNKTTLYKIAPDGNAQVLNSSIEYGVGCYVGNDDNVYVTNFESTNILRISPGGERSILATDSRLVGGGGIIMDNDGLIYNTFYAVNKVFKIESGQVTEFTQSNQFSGPVGMAYDKVRDQIYIANFNDGRIFLMGKDGTITEIADAPGIAGHLAYGKDHFYTTGGGNNRVYETDMDGNLTNTFGIGSAGTEDGSLSVAQFQTPNGVEASPDGKFVYVSSAEGPLRKIILERK